MDQYAINMVNWLLYYRRIRKTGREYQLLRLKFSSAPYNWFSFIWELKLQACSGWTYLIIYKLNLIWDWNCF